MKQQKEIIEKSKILTSFQMGCKILSNYNEGFEDGFEKGSLSSEERILKIIDEMQNRIRINSDCRGDLEELKQRIKSK